MKSIKVVALSVLVLGLLGCESRTDRADGGGVLLSITDFDGLPISLAVNSSGGFLQVAEIQIQSVIKNPDIIGTDLMNVEIQSYEVVYTRGDNGTVVPSPFVRALFGVVPAGGIYSVENLPVLAPEQFDHPPLSDLLFANGGLDKETGERNIIMNFNLRFFGRTLSGDAVETEPVSFTVTITP